MVNSSRLGHGASPSKTVVAHSFQEFQDRAKNDLIKSRVFQKPPDERLAPFSASNLIRSSQFSSLMSNNATGQCSQTQGLSVTLDAQEESSVVAPIVERQDNRDCTRQQIGSLSSLCATQYDGSVNNTGSW